MNLRFQDWEEYGSANSHFPAAFEVVIAKKARIRQGNLRNIETTNAIEALAFSLALKSNDWTPDSRLRGALKMMGKNELSFLVVRKSSLYVA